MSLFRTAGVAIAALCVVTAACAGSAWGQVLPESPAKPAGQWTGAMEMPGAKLAMSIFLKRDAKGWSGTLDVPSQGLRGMPLSGLVVEEGKLRFTLEGIPGDPTYEGAIQGDEIVGQFSQSGMEVPLTFRYGVEITTPLRPQEPKPPFPYEAIDVTFDSLSEGVKLAGTITIPSGEGPFPAVVLVSGSGGQNRNEEIFGHKPFLVLADLLTREGIAVLRYDDRGVGESTGDAMAATTLDLSMDAEAAVRYLRKQPRVRTDAVGIAGHSEGGIIAPMVAARSEDPSFIVLLAGPGVPGDQVLVRQVREGAIAEGMSADAAQSVSQSVSEMVDLIKADAGEAAIKGAIEKMLRLQAGIAPETPLPPNAVNAVYQQFGGAWFRYFLAYDPAEALRRVKVPVLVLQGKLDRQVNAQVNTGAIRKALEHNPTVQIEVLEGLNHLFQPAKTGGGSEYAQIETTMDEDVPHTIAQWISKITRQ